MTDFLKDTSMTAAFIGCIYSETKDECVKSRMATNLGLFDRKRCEIKERKCIKKETPEAVVLAASPSPSLKLRLRREAEAEAESEETKKRREAEPIMLRESMPHPERERAKKVKVPESPSARRKFKLPLNPNKITREDKALLDILRRYAKNHCSILVVLYLHGIIEPELPLITAPKDMCVTLVRTAPTGCVALEDTRIPIFRDISPGQTREMLLPDKTKRTAALARRSKAVLKTQQDMLSRFLPDVDTLDADFSQKIKDLDAGMRKTEGAHCDAVTCPVNQLFYNKRYLRKTDSSHLDIIEVVNFDYLKGVDLLNLMIKHGFGRRAGDNDTTTRDDVFKFFQALGATNLTVFDTTCSYVESQSGVQVDTVAYLRETEAMGALGGTENRARA